VGAHLPFRTAVRVFIGQGEDVIARKGSEVRV
jgi:hypothetical protein